jgi:hypothetical protein
MLTHLPTHTRTHTHTHAHTRTQHAHSHQHTHGLACARGAQAGCGGHGPIRELVQSRTREEKPIGALAMLWLTRHADNSTCAAVFEQVQERIQRCESARKQAFVALVTEGATAAMTRDRAVVRPSQWDDVFPTCEVIFTPSASRLCCVVCVSYINNVTNASSMPAHGWLHSFPQIDLRHNSQHIPPDRHPRPTVTLNLHHRRTH